MTLRTPPVLPVDVCPTEFPRGRISVLQGALRRAALVGVSCALAMAQPLAAEAACAVKSGPRTAALVELYTSEGCSSCPPADAQLKRINQAVDPGAVVVPLALHVTYWDAIGWKDPYARADFADRQSWLVHANGHAAVVTPHFFVGGVESRDWPGGLASEIRRQNATPARASIAVNGLITAPGVLSLQVHATAPAGAGHGALYLALTESGLVSQVTRGENAGSTLTHDAVVRAWVGPVPLQDGVAAIQKDVALGPGWVAGQLTAVGFVEDQDTGRVWQAVGAGSCALP